MATVGTYSGPPGTVFKPVLDGVQLWVKSINARGGLNGHRVNHIVYDDGGDPARHKAQVQEAIERRNAIAFLANAEAITGQSSVEYINSKAVPVVGTTGGLAWAYTSPMYFPQASEDEAYLLMGLAAVADQVLPSGKKKLATVVCVEAPACNTLDRVLAENAPRMGFDHVYRGRTSLAQPDYTSECLASRSNGAEVMLLALDANSLGRLSTACSRQGYNPQYAVFGTAAADRQKDDPKLSGLVSSSQVAPYFQTGTPATDEFQSAFKAFGAGIPNGVPVMAGWTAGKLLEKAGANLGEPATNQTLLARLWTIKNDNLDGLTYPLTFAQGRPAEPRACWFNIAVKEGEWRSPDGYKLRCLG